MPKVSVVMPVFNAEPFLEQALDSVLRQTWTDFELIAVDDGSTDQSARILASCPDSRLRVIRQANAGVAAALNAGVAAAAGEYIARMDADDVALPARFDRQVGFLDRNPDVDVVGSDVRIVDDLGRLSGSTWRRPRRSLALRRALLLGCPLMHPSVMMRRRLFAEFGAYRVEARHVEDYDLWLRAGRSARFANIPEPLLFYRRHEAAVGHFGAAEQEANTDLLMSRAAEAGLIGDGWTARFAEGFRETRRWRREEAFTSGDQGEDTPLFDLTALLTVAWVALVRRRRYRLATEILAEAAGCAAAAPGALVRFLLCVSWRWRRYYTGRTGVPSGRIPTPVFAGPSARLPSGVEDRKVAVCVVNWNGRETLRRCLDALVRNTSHRPVTFLVFDNGSTDGSAQMVEHDFPDVGVIKNPENIGYPAAVNRAFAACDAPLLAQVNSDVIVHEGWLDALVRCLDENLDAAMAGGRVLLPDGRTQFCGNVFGPTRMALRDRLFDPGERRAPVNFHGPAFVVRAEAWRAAGGFDEGYSPGYGEDAELGVALGLAGWKVLFEPQCRVTHLVSLTARRLGKSAFHSVAERHRLRFVLRNYPLSWLAVHLSLEWVKALLAVARGYFGSYCQAWSDIGSQWKEITRHRRGITGHPRYRLVFPRLWRVAACALTSSSRQRGNRNSAADAPVRVLLVSPVSELSGSPRALLTIARELKRAGRYAPQVAVPEDGWLVEALSREDIPVHFIDHPLMSDPRYRGRKPMYAFGFLRAAVRFAALCRGLGIGLVHVNTSVSPFAVLGARFAGLPVVAQYREIAVANAYQRIIGLVHAVSADVLVCCSASVRDTLHFGARGARVLYDGFEMPGSIDGPAAGARILAISRLCPEKGIEDLLSVFATVARQIPQARLDIVGDFLSGLGGFRERVLNTLKSEVFAGRVTIHGWQPDVEPYLRRSTFLLHLPRIQEGLPLVIAEAASFGLPAVAYRNGGIPEFLLDGETGFLVKQGDTDVAAACCLRLLSDRLLTERMGRAARNRVEREFSLGAATRRFTDLYDELIR